MRMHALQIHLRSPSFWMSYPNCQAQQRVSLARSEKVQPGKCLHSVRSLCSSLGAGVAGLETGGVKVDLVGHNVGQGINSDADWKPLPGFTSKQVSGEVIVRRVFLSSKSRIANKMEEKSNNWVVKSTRITRPTRLAGLVRVLYSNLRCARYFLASLICMDYQVAN